jgi:hypothetical protein
MIGKWLMDVGGDDEKVVINMLGNVHDSDDTVTSPSSTMIIPVLSASAHLHHDAMLYIADMLVLSLMVASEWITTSDQQTISDLIQ